MTPSTILPSNVVEILKVGLAGLCFLLSLLAFWLIHREQQRQSAPRKAILKAIYVFMASNLLVAALVGVAGYVGPRQEASPSTASPLLQDFQVVKARIQDLVATKTGMLTNLLEGDLPDEQKQRLSAAIKSLKDLDARLIKAAEGESSDTSGTRPDESQ